MTASKPPLPPGLGRQGEGLPDDVPFYGQVLGASVLPSTSCHPYQTNGWFPAVAGEWAPMTYARRWDPQLATDGSWRSREELDAGRDELELLNQVFGKVLDAKKVPYRSNGQHGRAYHVEKYLSDRDAYFGSTQAYLSYRDIARGELEADNGSLRAKIEPPKSVRNKQTGWKDAQDCFYAWTRKAFENKLGSAEKIVGIIRAGSSTTLRAALIQVRSDYNQKFGTQEANARPIKSGGNYRLGTLSDHATGDAVDIEPTKNAQISPKKWAAILAYTGKQLSTATRASLWKLDPRALHGAIAEVNQEFVRLLKSGMDAQSAAGVSDEKAAFAALMKANKHLNVLGADFLAKWKDGFFALPWALIKELHEEKLRWGAVFDKVDLHHFEVV